MSDQYYLRLEKLKLLEERKKLQDNLPHLYGFKQYEWAKEFFDSFAKLYFLSAPNQVGKSIWGMCKAVHWATEPSVWPMISNYKKPTLFFYFYPDYNLAQREIEHKWIPLILPKPALKDHPQYGWKLTNNKDELSIQFNTGVKIMFASYSTGRANLLALAASSPAAVFIDEEMHPDLWPEVSMRVEASKGCINFFATPVHCYPLYRDIFNGVTQLKGAIVKTISMFQCMKFIDGSPGLYTREDIETRIAKLGSKAEIQKRVFGKYVTPEGIVYSSFEKGKNVIPPTGVPNDWHHYSGVDIGTGGTAHPASICIVAVSPDYSKGRVVDMWRGDGVNTTCEDILDKYKQMTADIILYGEFYDWGSKDFYTISSRAGFAFQKAEKGRELGVNLLNTLFKNEMLSIDAVDESHKLINELETLTHNEIQGNNKRHAKDDLIDALRFAVTKIPWNFSHIKPKRSVAKSGVQAIDSRVQAIKEYESKKLDDYDEEYQLINDMVEGF